MVGTYLLIQESFYKCNGFIIFHLHLCLPPSPKLANFREKAKTRSKLRNLFQKCWKSTARTQNLREFRKELVNRSTTHCTALAHEATAVDQLFKVHCGGLFSFTCMNSSLIRNWLFPVDRRCGIVKPRVNRFFRNWWALVFCQVYTRQAPFDSLQCSHGSFFVKIA